MLSGGLKQIANNFYYYYIIISSHSNKIGCWHCLSRKCTFLRSIVDRFELELIVKRFREENQVKIVSFGIERQTSANELDMFDQNKEKSQNSTKRTQLRGLPKWCYIIIYISDPLPSCFFIIKDLIKEMSQNYLLHTF